MAISLGPSRVTKLERWSQREGRRGAEMIDETLFDAEEKMEKAVSVSRDDLSTIRTGRANPSMFNRIVIDYYGSATPITQLASINVPEARLVVIKPYEASQLGPIEAAIRKSDLGVNPTNDGTLIRVAVPQLTEERRRELVKQAKAKGEDAKVSVRNIRRKAMEELHRIRKDGEAGEDEVSRAEKDLDKSTQQYVTQIEDLVKHKEGELLEAKRPLSRRRPCQRRTPPQTPRQRARCRSLRKRSLGQAAIFRRR